MLEGSKVILRGYKVEDAEFAYKYINDFECKNFLSVDAPFPISLKDEREWVSNRRSNGGLAFDFAIEDIKTGKFIGGCSTQNVDIKNRNCMIGIMIGDKDYWGKGYGDDALRIFIKFIFEELNMNKISLGVFSFNERAIKCYKKLGFIEEGCFKEQIFKSGKYFDEIRMAILAKDYFEKYS